MPESAGSRWATFRPRPIIPETQAVIRREISGGIIGVVLAALYIDNKYEHTKNKRIVLLFSSRAG